MKNLDRVQVSIVLAAYNSSDTIKETLDSLSEQSFTNYEIIVIDDGSTDNTVEIVESHNNTSIRLIRQENRGLAASLNRGINFSRGKYIARIDADDVCYPERIQTQFDLLEGKKSLVICGSFADLMTEEGEYISLFGSLPLEDPDIRLWAEKFNPFIHPSVMFRKETALKAGGYDETLKSYFEDYLFFSNLLRFGEAQNIAKPLIKYRLRKRSLSLRRKPFEFRRIMNNIVRRGFTYSGEKKKLDNIAQNVREKLPPEHSYYLLLARLHSSNDAEGREILRCLTLAFSLRRISLDLFGTCAYIFFTVIKNFWK